MIKVHLIKDKMFPDYCKNFINVETTQGLAWIRTLKFSQGFTGIYGESRAELKHLTWALLRHLYTEHESDQLSWLCVGDFNEILFHHEKEGVYREARRV